MKNLTLLQNNLAVRNVVNTLVSFRQVLILYEIVVSSLPAKQTRASISGNERE